MKTDERAAKWQMKFSVNKCKVMHVRTPLSSILHIQCMGFELTMTDQEIYRDCGG